MRYEDGTVIEGGFPHKIRALEFLKNKQKGILLGISRFTPPQLARGLLNRRSHGLPTLRKS